jgi:hypothetical protein
MKEEKEKMIRFIDSHYNPLFYIPDGGNVVLTYSDGEKAVRPCKFLDEYHTQVGYNVYHICQFAELMEQNGTSYEPEKPMPLPRLCYSTLPATGELILLIQGEKGYRKCEYSAPHRKQNEMTAAQENRRMGVTPQQAAAMMGGAMRGWSTPAARTSSYDLKGNPAAPTGGKALKHKEEAR